ncbi:hypothetical protein CBL_11223 [Carabus blaptoides fortunei]
MSCGLESSRQECVVTRARILQKYETIQEKLIPFAAKGHRVSKSTLTTSLNVLTELALILKAVTATTGPEIRQSVIFIPFVTRGLCTDGAAITTDTLHQF